MRKFAILAAAIATVTSLAGCSHHHSGSGGMGGGGYFASDKH